MMGEAPQAAETRVLPHPHDILLGDPLREPTRKERRALLGVSTVAIALAWTGKIPEKISALGVDISIRNKEQLLLLCAGVVLYFLVAFIAYAASDFIVWRLTFSRATDSREDGKVRALWKLGKEDPQKIEVEAVSAPSDRRFRAVVDRMRIPVICLRVVVEFGLPVAIALYAVAALLAGRAQPPN